MPQVSVVLPAYEPGDLLERAVDSVLTQTMTDLELVVVDDGSPTDVGWVADLPDPRVRLVRQPNRGVSVARNVGVQHSSSPLVAFLDQDDEWLPVKLERQLATVQEQPDAAFWYTDFVWVLAAGDQPSGGQVVTYAGLLANQHVCLSSVVVDVERYAAVGGQDPLLRVMQDWDLFLRLSMEGAVPAGTAESLVRYYVHGGNVSADYRTAHAERSALLAAHRRRAERRGDAATVDAVRRGLDRTDELFASQAVDRARETLGAGRLVPTGRHLAAAARMDPAVVVRSAGTAVRRRLRRGG